MARVKLKTFHIEFFRQSKHTHQKSLKSKKLMSKPCVHVTRNVSTMFGEGWCKSTNQIEKRGKTTRKFMNAVKDDLKVVGLIEGDAVE